jgi:polar amino acid transport system substrate-binding protein
MFFFAAAVKASELQIFREKNESNKIIELVDIIKRKAGFEQEIIAMPWARSYKMITSPNSKNIVSFPMAYTEKRRDLFHWVGPIRISTWQLYAKADSNIVIKSLDDAKKLGQIGIHRGDAREDFLISKGFTNISTSTYAATNIEKLTRGRIDLWLSSNEEAISLTRKENVDFNLLKPVFRVKEIALYIAFHINTAPEIVNKWQKAYVEVRQDGTMKQLLDSAGLEMPQLQILP